MAAVATPADQATDLIQKLSLESQPKALDIPEPAKKPSINSGNGTNGQFQPYERSVTPILQEVIDPAMCYLPNAYPSSAYYYGGGFNGEWDDYSRYLNHDGVDMPPGIYGDNGSLMYHHGYGYAPYGPYSPATSPVPTVGHDGQLYGAQHYQYPTTYFQPATPTSGSYSPSPAAPPKGDISTTAAADQDPLPVDSSNGIANGAGVKVNNGSAPIKPTYPNSSYNSNGSYGRGGLPGGIHSSGYQDPRFGFDGLQSPIPWLDGPIFSDGHPRSVTSTSLISNANNVPSSRNQNIRPHSHVMGLHHPRPIPGVNTANGYINRMYQSKLYGQYGNSFRSGVAYGSNGYDSRASGRGWLAVDSKYKPRGRGNGFFGFYNENIDGLNEMNRGPRAKNSKSQKAFVPVVLAVKGQNIPLNGSNDDEMVKSGVIPDREQYNRADFLENYADAKFFIIKSYSEDDVHKSIKYNVWASTPNGNRKLDAAFHEAQQKSGGCPVFLFFSVNTSGQFVGVAEMVSSVDFHKNVEYWQQDKWNGNFSVKWHIVKDVPNSLLKHITLENNDNKPVTNSRDTQEVKLDQGLQMLKIFKEYSSKTCILDDFGFYEGRQKTIQEKKAKQQQFLKQAKFGLPIGVAPMQVWEGKPTEEKTKGDLKSEAALDLTKEPSPAVQSDGDVKLSENESAAKSGDVLKGTKPALVSEKIASNGVAYGC